MTDIASKAAAVIDLHKWDPDTKACICGTTPGGDYATHMAQALAGAGLLLDSAPEPFRFTNPEWHEYQRLPDQGISHRHWLEARINRRVAPRTPPTAEEIADVIYPKIRRSEEVRASEMGRALDAATAVLELLTKQPTRAVAQLETGTEDHAS